jgi:hypothetical protein
LSFITDFALHFHPNEFQLGFCSIHLLQIIHPFLTQKISRDFREDDSIGRGARGRLGFSCSEGVRNEVYICYFEVEDMLFM